MPHVGDGAVVRDPEHERALGAVAAKGGQRPPQGEPDLLHEVLAPGGLALVAGGQPADGGLVLADDPEVLRFAPFGHALVDDDFDHAALLRTIASRPSSRAVAASAAAHAASVMAVRTATAAGVAGSPRSSPPIITC